MHEANVVSLRTRRLSWFTMSPNFRKKQAPSDIAVVVNMMLQDKGISIHFSTLFLPAMVGFKINNYNFIH